MIIMRRIVSALAMTALLLGVYFFAFGPSDDLFSKRDTGEIGGAFTLTDHRGETVTQETYQDRYLLIYFGFTYCPDICPMALLAMSGALDRLGPKASSIQPLFITVDPERDTVEVMAGYVTAIDPRLTGLTGSPAQIKQVADAYKVYYKKNTDPRFTDYLVDHTSAVYFMGPDGAFLAHFDHQTDPATIAQTISAHLDA